MMAVIALIGAYGGSQADERFETAPWFLILGTFFGIGLGLWRISKNLISSQSDDEP
jgi:F0F1-type ATP synthase assembly protein I